MPASLTGNQRRRASPGRARRFAAAHGRCTRYPVGPNREELDMASQNGSFAGKVAFATGAANGIGRAAALAFAREGAAVAVADVSEQGIQETVRLIEQAGGRALGVRCDVSRADDVKATLDKTV